MSSVFQYKQGAVAEWHQQDELKCSEEICYLYIVNLS
jgi:hypothetical protein